jgi:hypothetical protein
LRTRSPSWRNKLIEKDIRQSPALPGFCFFLHVAVQPAARGQFFSFPAFDLVQFCRT